MIFEKEDSEMPEPRRTPTKDGFCHYCGIWFDVLTKDHIVPRAKGGPDDAWNINWSCWQCNQDKADNLPDCECAKCRGAILRVMGAEGERWGMLSLRQIAPGSVVRVSHKGGSVLVGRKLRGEIDDMIAVAGMGSIALHKLWQGGWVIDVEEVSEKKEIA